MDTPSPNRGLFGIAILALPIALTAFVIVAYGGLFALGYGGRAGTTPITLSFTACPEAEPVVRARLEDMGFDPAFTPQPDGFSVSFDGPEDASVRASLPVDLARPGRFEVHAGGSVLATGADVVDASVRVDALMVPTTLVRLSPDASQRVSAAVKDDPAGQLDFYVDGERVGGQAYAALGIGEVEIAPPIEDDAARLRATAAWSVIIDHPPLPCPVSPRSG